MGVGKKPVSLRRVLDIPIKIKPVLSALSLSLLLFIKPEISLRQSISYVRERSVSAVDKDM